MMLTKNEASCHDVIQNEMVRKISAISRQNYLNDAVVVLEKLNDDNTIQTGLDR